MTLGFKTILKSDSESVDALSVGQKTMTITQAMAILNATPAQRKTTTIEAAVICFINEAGFNGKLADMYTKTITENICKAVANGEVEKPDKMPLLEIDPKCVIYSDSVIKYLFRI